MFRTAGFPGWRVRNDKRHIPHLKAESFILSLRSMKQTLPIVNNLLLRAAQTSSNIQPCVSVFRHNVWSGLPLMAQAGCQLFPGADRGHSGLLQQASNRDIRIRCRGKRKGPPGTKARWSTGREKGGRKMTENPLQSCATWTTPLTFRVNRAQRQRPGSRSSPVTISHV